MRTYFYALRSTLIGLIVIPNTLFCSCMVALMFPFGFRVQYLFVKLWAHVAHYCLCYIGGLSYEVIGKENLPNTASVSFIKHQSAWETILFFRILPPSLFVLKRELMSIPIFGWALGSIKMVDIDRKSGASAVKQVIEKGGQRLKEGRWISIFPEGTRMLVGKTRKFGMSGALLAKDAGTPLVTIAHNAGEFWTTKSLLINPGKITVIIKEPIYPDGKTAEEMLTESKTWMEKTMRENFPKYKEMAEHYEILGEQDSNARVLGKVKA